MSATNVAAFTANAAKPGSAAAAMVKLCQDTIDTPKDYNTRGGSDGGKQQRFEQFRPRLSALAEIIAGPGAPPRSRIRATAALFAASGACIFFMSDEPEPHAVRAAAGPAQLPDRDELRKIVLELADDLTQDIGAAS